MFCFAVSLMEKSRNDTTSTKYFYFEASFKGYFCFSLLSLTKQLGPRQDTPLTRPPGMTLPTTVGSGCFKHGSKTSDLTSLSSLIIRTNISLTTSLTSPLGLTLFPSTPFSAGTHEGLSFKQIFSHYFRLISVSFCPMREALNLSIYFKNFVYSESIFVLRKPFLRPLLLAPPSSQSSAKQAGLISLWRMVTLSSSPERLASNHTVFCFPSSSVVIIRSTSTYSFSSNSWTNIRLTLFCFLRHLIQQSAYIVTSFFISKRIVVSACCYPIWRSGCRGRRQVYRLADCGDPELANINKTTRYTQGRLPWTLDASNTAPNFFNLTRYVEYGLPVNILSLLFQFAGSGTKLPDPITDDNANFNKGCMDCYFGNTAPLLGEKSLLSLSQSHNTLKKLSKTFLTTSFGCNLLHE